VFLWTPPKNNKEQPNPVRQVRKILEKVTASDFLKALEDGPMTSAELAEVLGASPRHASATMLLLIKHPQRAHIKSWVNDHSGQRRYPRALYALGQGSNAKKPKADPLARKREYEARKKSIFKTSSVFNLAIPLKCLRSRSSHGTKTANSVKSAPTIERFPTIQD
jgi:hypothetical protein